MTPAAKRDPEATREAILDAAEEVFLEKGYGDSATSVIAKKAGVTKSLIHHHYGSKGELWNHVKRRRFDQFAAQLYELFEQSSEPDDELLKEAITLYFHFLEANPQVVRMLAWMSLEGDEDCSEPGKMLNEASVAKLRAGQERGFLRGDVDPRHLFFMFLSLTQYWFEFGPHFCHDVGMDPLSPESNQRYLRTMLKVFFEGAIAR